MLLKVLKSFFIYYDGNHLFEGDSLGLKSNRFLTDHTYLQLKTLCSLQFK